MIIIIQILFALFLFAIINWLGKHSYSIGYISLDVFAKSDEAPAFNFIFRVLTPVAYLFITAAILYAFGLDFLVKDFYLVNVYYLAIRLIVNLAMERGELMNWPRQFVYWFFILLFSYFAYTKIIVTKKNLLPDFSNLSNELWFILLIFVYQIFNKIELSNTKTEKRKSNYIGLKLNLFEKKYGSLINKQLANDQLKGLVYAILIIENFNRPKLVRLVENLRFRLTKKPHTLGVMQVRSSKKLNDYQSVVLGIQKIKDDYQNICQNYLNDATPDYYREGEIKSELISHYNSGAEYYNQVYEMWEIVMERKYPKTNNKLFEKIL